MPTGLLAGRVRGLDAQINRSQERVQCEIQWSTETTLDLVFLKECNLLSKRSSCPLKIVLGIADTCVCASFKLPSKLHLGLCQSIITLSTVPLYPSLFRIIGRSRAMLCLSAGFTSGLSDISHALPQHPEAVEQAQAGSAEGEVVEPEPSPQVLRAG